MHIHDYEEPFECHNCQHKDNQLDDVKCWLLAIHEHLYGQQELNEELLHHCLIELSLVANVKHSESPLNIQRKPRKNSIHPIDDWIEFNNQYLKTVGVPL